MGSKKVGRDNPAVFAEGIGNEKMRRRAIGCPQLARVTAQLLQSAGQSVRIAQDVRASGVGQVFPFPGDRGANQQHQ